MISEAFEIWQRLISRLKIKRTALPPICQVGEMVVPVTSVDELLLDWDVWNDSVSLVGTGLKDVVSPEPGERWKIWAITATRSTGDRTINDIWVTDQEGEGVSVGGGFAAASEKSTGMLNQPVILDRGWDLQLSITGGSSDGSWYVRLLITREKSYSA